LLKQLSRSRPLSGTVGPSFTVQVSRSVGRRNTNSVLQRFYSVYKHYHALKYQGIVAPDTILVHLVGPYLGSHHNLFMLNDSRISACMLPTFACIAHPLGSAIMSVFFSTTCAPLTTGDLLRGPTMDYQHQHHRSILRAVWTETRTRRVFAGSNYAVE